MQQYVQDLLRDYNMEDCNPIATPLAHAAHSSANCPSKNTAEWHAMQKIPFRELICKLAHLSRTVRPDISFAVGVLSRFMDNPGMAHWTAAKRILRYLKGRPNSPLVLEPGPLARSTGKFQVSAYVDADHAGNRDSSKSTTGYFIFVGTALTAWNSKLQSSITTSSTHAEHYATYHCVIDLIWHRNMLRAMNLLDETPSIISGDSQPSQNHASDWMVTSRYNHFDVKLRYATSMNKSIKDQLNSDMFLDLTILLTVLPESYLKKT